MEDLIGVDEVGMGALVGCIVVAAVAITPGIVAGVRDSKLVREDLRYQLAEDIKKCAKAWKIAQVGNDFIDRNGIDAAWDKAVISVLEEIRKEVDYPAVVDGDKLPSKGDRVYALPKADSTVYQVAAASLVAKAHRDMQIVALANKYPQYDLEKNKGYPTKKHLEALKKYGPTPHHRKSFRPTLDPSGSLRREELEFDKSRADSMVSELSHLNSHPRASDWEKQFCSDMSMRLSKGIPLSPRQMFFLSSIHGRRRKR
jgi:ribonuclease HII